MKSSQSGWLVAHLVFMLIPMTILSVLQCFVSLSQVYFELKHHAPQLKRIIDDQHARFDEAQGKLSKVRKKQSGLEDRINHAMLQHNLLEQRLHCLKNLAGAHKKPLSKAEREFKSDTRNQFYARSNFNEIMQISGRHSYKGPSITMSFAKKMISLCSNPFLLPLSHNSLVDF